MIAAFLAAIILSIVGFVASMLAPSQESSWLWLSTVATIFFVLASLSALIFLIKAGLGGGGSRRERRTQNYKTTIFSLILILFTAGLGIMNISIISQLQDQDYLRKNGVVTQAEVVSQSERRTKGGTSHSIWYQFDVTYDEGDTRTYSNIQPAGSDSYYKLERGSSVTIVYDPANPTNSNFEDKVTNLESIRGYGLFNAGYPSVPIYVRQNSARK